MLWTMPLVKKNENRVWKGILRIPETHISVNISMNDSKIINFEYSIAIEVHVSTFSRRQEVKLPIFIGTKKLEELT